MMFLNSYYSLCWAGDDYFYVKRDYPKLLPSRPRVVDPANPANNVWISGFRGYKKGEIPYGYAPGDGNSRVLRRKIRTIDI